MKINVSTKMLNVVWEVLGKFKKHNEKQINDQSPHEDVNAKNRRLTEYEQKLQQQQKHSATLNELLVMEKNKKLLEKE